MESTKAKAEACWEGILNLISEGKTVRAACDQMGVHRTQFFRLATSCPEYRDQYEIAKESGYKVWAEEILDISDDSSGETPRDKLRVDARKWLLSKVMPKVYGDRVQIGNDEDKAFQVEFRETQELREQIADMARRIALHNVTD